MYYVRTVDKGKEILVSKHNNLQDAQVALHKFQQQYPKHAFDIVQDNQQQRRPNAKMPFFKPKFVKF